IPPVVAGAVAVASDAVTPEATTSGATSPQQLVAGRRPPPVDPFHRGESADPVNHIGVAAGLTSAERQRRGDLRPARARPPPRSLGTGA
ncbi:hypothetical protein THAOC_27130, partial [Thalassiosira oceanica]